MFSATDPAWNSTPGRRDAPHSPGALESWEGKGEERGDGYGATRLTSNTWFLPPVFLSLQGWRWDPELDVHVCKDTHHCASIHTATKILQKIHAVKPHVLVCVTNVKYPSWTLLTMRLILKAELMYASVYWRLDAIGMSLKHPFNHHRHLHVGNVSSVRVLTAQDASHALQRPRPRFWSPGGQQGPWCG